MSESFELSESKDTLGRFKGMVARVTLKHYAVAPSGAGTAIIQDQIVNLAQECFGQLLSGVGEGEMGGFEFGFEGDKDAAAMQDPPITVTQHARMTAAMFSSLVNHRNWYNG